MEHLYRPRMKSTGTFDSTKFSEFSKEISDLYNSGGTTLEEISQQYQDKIGCVSQKNLSKVLQPNLSELNEPYFLHKMKEIPVPPKAEAFKCVRRAISAMKRTKRRTPASRMQRNTMSQLAPKDVKSLTVPESTQEIVFSVKVFDPFKYITGCRKTPKVGQEIKLLGTQKLTVLRNNIRCYRGPFLDVSDEPDKKSEVITPDSGFIFVNDTFYNDIQDETHCNYSEIIRQWTENKSIFRKLHTEAMEDTLMKDLKFKIGFPYVYQHYGNCEHLLMFYDVRLVTPKEVATRIGFPIVINGLRKEIYCYVCGLTEAMYVIMNSTEHIQDPSHLCNHCLNMYHYKDGQKIGDFNLYRIKNPS